MHGLSDNLEVRVVGAPVAAGSSIDNNSSRIDMDGYESVMFIAPITDSVQNGVATLTIEQNTADSDSGMAAVSGSAATDTSAANDDLNDKCLRSEVFKPTQRYVQAVRTSSAANIAYGSLIAVLKPLRKPVTDHSTVLATSYVAN